MSYSSLYGVPEKGEIEFMKKYQNSWGTAPHVWNDIFDKYIKTPENPYIFSQYDKLWPLADDEKLPEFERGMLKFTLDQLMVKKENFPELISIISEYVEKFPKDKGVVNHWPQIAKDLSELDFSKYTAICFIWTSVADDVWDAKEKCVDCFNQVCEKEDHYNEEDGIVWRKWDISKDEGHWFMFQE